MLVNRNIKNFFYGRSIQSITFAFIASLIFLLLQCTEVNLVLLIQKVYQTHNIYTFYNLFSDFDKNIPIMSWMSPFYTIAVGTWFIFPFIIYIVYGPKQTAKLCGISSLVYAISFAISIIFPADASAVQEYGKSLLSNSTNFFDKMNLFMLENNFPLLSFPSNHCSNQLLLCFSILTCMITTTNKEDWKIKNKWFYLKLLLMILCIAYTAIVCISTFALKAHYFYDWIPSLVICLVLWITMSLIKNDPFQNFYLKLIINTGWVLKCFDDRNAYEYKNYLTWGNIYSKENKFFDKKKQTIRINGILITILILFITLIATSLAIASQFSYLFNLFHTFLTLLSFILIALLLTLFINKEFKQQIKSI